MTLFNSYSDIFFELYKNTQGKYDFRIKSKNGKILASSVQGYENKADVKHAIDLIKNHAKDAEIKE